MNRNGTLQVISHNKPRSGGGSMTVLCDCGNTFECFASRWKNYSGKGCNKCFKSRLFSGKNNPKYKHGGYLEWNREYQSYTAMIRRCYEPSYRSYKWYGAKGISVCERWRDKENGFSNFIEDMKHKPSPKHTLDRIDNLGDYSPGNCRWADQQTQINNSTASRYITINGVTKNLRDWLKVSPITNTTFFRRTKIYGWDVEKALMTPSKTGQRGIRNSL